MKNVEEQIQELREMSREQLIERFEEVWGKPPRVRSREYLWKRTAYKLQENAYGGLPRRAQAELERLIANLDLPWNENTRRVTGKLKGPHRPGDPQPGTVLERHFKGECIRVTVLEDGYEWNGQRYRSLTAVALAVTGSKWNGRMFFGLTERAR